MSPVHCARCPPPPKQRSGEGHRQAVAPARGPGPDQRTGSRGTISAIVLIWLDRKPGIEDATCRRTLWPDGTLFENVVLGTSHQGRDLTNEELDKWVDSFPIEPLQTGWPCAVLPTDFSR